MDDSVFFHDSPYLLFRLGAVTLSSFTTWSYNLTSWFTISSTSDFFLVPRIKKLFFVIFLQIFFLSQTSRVDRLWLSDTRLLLVVFPSVRDAKPVYKKNKKNKTPNSCP